MRKKKNGLKLYGLCALLVAGFGLTAWSINAATPRAAAMYTIYEGTIYPITDTAEQAKTGVPIKAEVVVVKANKIEFVGTKAKAAADSKKFYDNAKVVDLGGNVMLPGFFDPHGHFPYSAGRLTNAYLYPSPIGNVNTITDIQNTLKDNIRIIGPSEYATGSGYDDTMLDTGLHPTAEELGAGSLADVYVSVRHISGHFASVNTKVLTEMTGTTYLKGGLTTLFKADKDIEDTDEITACKIIDNNGTMEFNLVITNGSGVTRDFPIGGVVVKSGATATDTSSEVAAKLTGLLVEHAAYKLADPMFKAGSAMSPEIVAHASTEYASRGVTTANAGGEATMAHSLWQAQTNLLNDKLKIRMVMQPRVYTNIGHTMAAKSTDNHNRLGWTGVSDGNMGTLGPIGTGSDITSWNAGSFTVAPGTITGLPGVAGDSTTDPGKLATLQRDNPEKYQDRIILGTWKFSYDGSIQGYTGYLGPKGYYDKGNNTAWNPKCIEGSSPNPNGEATKTNAKLFTTAGEHYGLAGSTASISETLFMKTINDYHSKGQGISLHLNGSWANENIVTAIERAIVATPSVTNTRHTIIHAQMQELQHIQRFMGNYDEFPIDSHANTKRFTDVLTGANEMKTFTNGTNGEANGSWGGGWSDAATAIRANSQRMKDQNIISSYFLDHTYYWGERHKNIFMGPGRADNMSPLGWATELDHVYTLHTDTPIVSMNPLLSIENAVNRMSSGYPHAGPITSPGRALISGTGKDLEGEIKHPATKGATALTTFHNFDQRINVLQAVRGVTYNSAYSSKMEDKLGSIAIGKYADFVILGQDIFNTPTNTIAQTPVVATIVNNEVVHGVLPDATDFITNEVRPSLNTPAEPALAITTSVPTEQELPDVTGKIILGARKFVATGVTVNEYAVFTMQFQGNGDAVSSIGLHKVKSNIDQTPFAYEADLAIIKSAAGSGKFMITTLIDQHMPLAPSAILQNNVQYIVHYTIKDGDATFDADSTVDQITDPAMISADTTPTIGGMPNTGGGGGSGCTIGTTTMYDMMLLFVVAFSLIAFRTIKRRN